MRRQRGSGQSPVACRENLRQLFRAKPFLPDFEQSSRDCSHHILEKAVTADAENPIGVRAVPRRFIDRARPVFDLRRRGTKRGKVVSADKTCCALIQDLWVERVAKCVHVAAMKRADDGVPPDVIFVCLRTSGPARVELRAHFFHGQDADFPRKQCVHALQDRIRIHRADGANIRNLPVCVNAGISPARTRHLYLMIQKLLKGLVKLALNGSELWLNLPAVELRAVVCKSQLEVPHSLGYSMCLGARAMPGITATIITFNEEARIGETIASLSCCDEVLVVDAGSTDRTREIAGARGARIIEHPWEGYSKQKNFAALRSPNDWILSIDADERLTIELADEIVQWKRESRSAAACSVPRRAFYMGRWIHHSGWYPDRKIRLYDRRRCRWEGDFVHEQMKADGPVAEFGGDLLHFPYRDWSDHAARIERYTELAARAAISSGRRSNVVKLLLGPPLTFLRGLFLHAGFLDGWRGLAIAYMAARYVFKREFRIVFPSS